MLNPPNMQAATSKRRSPRTKHRPEQLNESIDCARATIESQQYSDGYWDYQLEADCTIPAEYIMMMHFTDDIDRALEIKIANYLRAHQCDHHGWALYHGGSFDLSCSVKTYFALKLVGDNPDAEHMRRARKAILSHGGAAKANVFTRIALALFEQVPWRAVPFIPVEVMLLPKWFPFHISKVSYWSRTVMVPLFILCSLKPSASNPRRINITELFTVAPDHVNQYFHPTNKLSRLFLSLDYIGRNFLEPLIPNFVRKKALKKAEHWVIERLNGEDGLGAIFPAMVNAHESLLLLGYDEKHPLIKQTKASLEKLLIIEQDSAYCQPCFSPMWDTGLASLALHETAKFQQIDDMALSSPQSVIDGLDWLAQQQLHDEPGDWRDNNPNLEGGGWPFQFANSHYPDLDDTSLIGWAMSTADHQRYAENINRAANWVVGMQSTNGGFAAFDRDNTHDYLNHIPFADHGALLDPPTADVTARCIALLGLTNEEKYRPALLRAIDFLKRTQEKNGSWFGRWGTNYIYGTWSVLSALEVAGQDMQQDWIQKAAAWLIETQHFDGGWGESNDSYYDHQHEQPHSSTSYQTAWAILGLIAAGHTHSSSLKRAIDFLIDRQEDDGLWSDDSFTAPGFPKVFYLKYHGYTKFFPLWALALYRNKVKQN